MAGLLSCLLKHATRPETSGYCPDCGVTDFFKNQSPLGQLIRDKDMLLASHVQTQFAKLMLTGNADARPEEINWQRVHDNWDLPFQKPRRAKRQSR